MFKATPPRAAKYPVPFGVTSFVNVHADRAHHLKVDPSPNMPRERTLPCPKCAKPCNEFQRNLALVSVVVGAIAFGIQA